MACQYKHILFYNSCYNTYITSASPIIVFNYMHSLAYIVQNFTAIHLCSILKTIRHLHKMCWSPFWKKNSRWWQITFINVNERIRFQSILKSRDFSLTDSLDSGQCDRAMGFVWFVANWRELWISSKHFKSSVGVYI